MNSGRPPKPSPQDREAALFEMALEKSGSEREAFLRAVSADDAALHSRLKALLAAHEQEDGVLAAPAAPVRVRVKPEPPDQQKDEAVGETIGHYKLLEKVGEGGCGVVYLAEQSEPIRRRVALKVIKEGMDTKAVVARFEAERQALSVMDHPNIAKVFDAGSTETGRPYFVMELVRGIRITDYCDRNNLPTKERLGLFIEVCHAVQHAHQKGIIHRDIKPSNILVTLQDGVPLPKVIDFGVAKAIQGRLTDATVYTQLHQLIGTPAYMSPEQAEMTSMDVDTRSDIYSLGVLLYELLTGRTPFDAKELLSAGIDAMRRTLRETEPLRPSTRLATLKPDELTTTAKRRSAEAPRLICLLKGDLDWIVMKCLEKDRTRRYATATSLAHDLRRHLSNEPVEASPPDTLYRLKKFLIRHKVQVAFGTGFVAFLMAALALALASGKTQARLRAQAQLEFRNSEARRLFAEANYVVSSHPQRGLLLFVEALNAHLDHGELPMLAIEQAFLPALTNISGFCLGTASGGMQCVALSPDARWVAAGGREGNVRLWDLASPKGRQSAPLINNTTNLVSALAISPDSQWLASGDARGAVTVWRLGPNGVSKSQDLVLHANRINAVLFGNQSRWLVTACEKGVAALWDLGAEPATSKPAVFVNEHGAITASAMTRTPAWLLLGDENGNVSVLRLPALSLVARSDPASGHTGRINALCLRQDDRELVTAGEDGTARRWRLDSDGTLDFLTALKGHQGGVTAIAYKADGGVITGGADGQVLVWNESSSNTNRIALTGHHDSVTAMGPFKSKGWTIAGGPSEVIVWSASTANIRPGLKVTASPNALAAGELWSDPVAHAYAAYQRERTYTEDLESAGVPQDWEAYLDPLAGLRLPAQPTNFRLVVSDERLFPGSKVGGVTSITLSSDGKRVVTSGYDGSVIVTEGNKVGILRGHEGPVTSVAMNSTGDLIVTSSWDGSVRIWASPGLESKLPLLKPGFDVIQRIRAQIRDLSAKEPAAFDRSAFARDLVILARERVGRNFTAQEWRRVFPGRDYRKTFEEFPGL